MVIQNALNNNEDNKSSFEANYDGMSAIKKLRSI